MSTQQLLYEDCVLRYCHDSTNSGLSTGLIFYDEHPLEIALEHYSPTLIHCLTLKKKLMYNIHHIKEDDQLTLHLVTFFGL